MCCVRSGPHSLRPVQAEQQRNNKIKQKYHNSKRACESSSLTRTVGQLRGKACLRSVRGPESRVQSAAAEKHIEVHHRKKHGALYDIDLAFRCTTKSRIVRSNMHYTISVRKTVRKVTFEEPRMTKCSGQQPIKNKKTQRACESSSLMRALDCERKLDTVKHTCYSSSDMSSESNKQRTPCETGQERKNGNRADRLIPAKLGRGVQPKVAPEY